MKNPLLKSSKKFFLRNARSTRTEDLKQDNTVSTTIKQYQNTRKKEETKEAIEMLDC